jgi:hypothetical protein
VLFAIAWFLVASGMGLLFSGRVEPAFGTIVIIKGVILAIVQVFYRRNHKEED